MEGSRRPKQKENALMKAKRRFLEEPLVPIGLVLVVGVFGRGLKALYSGDSKTSFRMMRYRVLFQGATVVAILYGMYFHHFTKQNNSTAMEPGNNRLAVDKRYYLENAKKWNIDVQREEDATTKAVADGSDSNTQSNSQSMQLSAER
eukprot:gb/GECG01015005.1/.p1 GENE.gb/GECG01015005.1/~~gb/GECG01015005.1/.p1  ORF type:complete len:147 (+),score=18.34 gb/GECG01015005.1/:1-441(+)